MSVIRVGETPVARLRPHWNWCVGTERMGIALQKEYLDHLKMVKEAVGFKYIRGHGLLHDDTGIYREYEVDGEKRPFYNFTYIDRIFDSFLDLGIRPFVELGFMPSALASGDQTVFYWKGNVTPPKDYGRWRDLIRAVVAHFVDRYGLDEVKTWFFEVWNEPNLTVFWKDADMAEYFKLYRVTAEAVKSVHPDLKVGGPAICGGADHWIQEFLAFCHRENVPLDFVTRHAYTAKMPNTWTPDVVYQDLHEPMYMLDELRTVRGMIDETPFRGLPFYITEFNTSYNPLNPVHDTALNAAYLARILSEAGDWADAISYWTFSDVFEEMDVPKAQFHGGFGLVALNGIPKPTFHLFAFFNRLGEEVLYRDERVIVTRRPDGSVALAAWNLVMERGDGFETRLELDVPAPADDLFVQRETVDEQYGNPWKVWQQLGRPRFPSKSQVGRLKKAAVPLFRSERKAAEGGRLLLDLTLTKNEVTLVEIVPVRDETATYIGLDDSKIPSYG